MRIDELKAFQYVENVGARSGAEVAGLAFNYEEFTACVLYACGEWSEWLELQHTVFKRVSDRIVEDLWYLKPKDGANVYINDLKVTKP